MFEAVAVAVIAMKDEDGDLANARRILDGILDKHGLRLPTENLAVLIQHGKTLDESVRITMSRESSPDDKRYNRYQRLLQSELRRQELAGAYQHTIHVTATDSIGCVQDRLRKFLLEKTANPLFQPTMHHLVGIYAFGGLSECGKSTIAEAFCAIFGTKQAFRAKIAYFNNTRRERSLVPLEQLTRNDGAKLERGAMNIRSYADLVLDNNGPLSESISTLMSFSEGKGLVPGNASVV
ncbi:hypothetical protein, variant [Gaeumannomyces tritici R3-111a-1]|uniref:Uncharacterized protein n=1 Tax=Gaeumannomyces tritici (strain R3-111a-1) TaxID=644352 RepID=J3P9D5_GAET3|nr:hypothetical protein, variant [Gaeumannomyces tritici R3-111a-1]EJT73270.1 hypothetical protein, variant [Gaeumannomyces tritici R3-111a-1]